MMTSLPLIACFSSVPDPRNDKNKYHNLIDVIVIGVCAVIGGCEVWEQIEEFAKSKEAWFKKFLKLPNGIPSYSTIRRVFLLIDPKKFQESFISWAEGLRELTGLDIVSIDGKTLRRSYNKSLGSKAIHMVSAWSSLNGMVLGQLKTEEKSNEITATPELLDSLYLKGSIVTIDAMGCQTEIAKQIIQGQGDYVLTLKGNQGILHEDVTLYFQEAISTDFKQVSHDFYEEIDKGHGRLEIRRYWIIDQIDWLKERHPSWEKLQFIGLVESERHQGEKVTLERRHYIASLEKNAKTFAKSVRNHWGVENPLHWCLDVTFREDESRIRSGHAPENFAVLRHVALNLLKKENTYKKSVKLKRMKVGWDNQYLERVLTG